MAAAEANRPDRYSENATILERLEWYSRSGHKEQGKALAKLADYLEECFLWDIDFNEA